MKFGDTLHQRSVPKWASYNLNYNHLKKLIKLRTTTGVAIPTPIPGQSSSRWADLDEELYGVLKEQYGKIGLFLRSKHGELDRRLSHLERQVRSAQRPSNLQRGPRHLQARKYQKLVHEADEIGEDIQALSRFAAVQKTGFRKILKKYRKWTGTTTLQTRLENEVFSDGQLLVDLAEPMQRLSSQMSILTDQLHAPMLKGQFPSNGPRQRRASNRSGPSAVQQISEAQSSTLLYFDASFATTTFGQAAGTATYWIHPDNLDEAKVMLLRYTRSLSSLDSLSRYSSSTSVNSQTSGLATPRAESLVHVQYFDNVQRFVQDHNANQPSRVALSARWSQANEAVVTLSDLARSEPADTILRLKHKDLASALDRRSPRRKDKDSPSAISVRTVQDYLQKHRDVKPIAAVHSKRLRFAGSTNSSEVGNWALLDTDITLSPALAEDLGDRDPQIDGSEAFPYAVLEIRWEFGRKPEVVHAFDTSHLAERVHDFTLEAAAIHSQSKESRQPTWTQMLGKDIRKVPVSRALNQRPSNTGIASGPSSTDGGADSVFSTAQDHSTAPSEVSPMGSSHDLSAPARSTPAGKFPPRKSRGKRARINAKSPVRNEARYYSEYDDPESEFNTQETYTIFVDPDKEDFPGAETISKAFVSMYRSLSNGKSKVLAWLPLANSGQSGAATQNERSPLLFNEQNWRFGDDGPDSSDSDSAPSPITDAGVGIKGFSSRKKRTKSKSAPEHQPHLSRRQRQHETTLFQFYTGLIVLSYILLLMTGMLLATGRKKEAFRVDIGAILGIVAAEMCALLSVVLIMMRKDKLGALHWGTAGVAITGVVVIGIGLLASTVARMA